MLQTAVLVLFSLFLTKCAGVMDEKRLHTDLLASYNKDVRPILNQTGAVTVQFGLALIDFNLDSDTDILDSSFWLRMKWKDEYLRWDPTEYGGISVTRFSPDDIWKPDIFLYNSWDAVSIQQVASMGSYPLVVPTGSVLWVPAVRLRSRCRLDRANWPQDRADCYLKFGSWTHHGFALNLSLYDNNENLDMSEFIGSQRWTPVNTSARLVNKIYSCCDEPYPSVEFNLTLQRLEHRTAEITVPLLVSACMMMLSFVVPVDHWQKLTLGWVSLVTALLGMLNMYNSMAEQAHGQAAIATFYTSYIVILMLFYIAEVCLVRLSRVSACTMPKCVRNVLSGVLGKFLCLDSPVFHNYSQEDNEMLDQPHADDGDFVAAHTNHVTKQRAPAPAAEWTLLATALDRILSLAFLAIMIVTLPPNTTW